MFDRSETMFDRLLLYTVFKGDEVFLQFSVNLATTTEKGTLFTVFCFMFRIVNNRFVRFFFVRSNRAYRGNDNVEETLSVIYPER